ncbi:MAG: hypothetical protein QOI21_1855 [Actinomycetota bacterium]|nr:hypothetical protein [Actinomycetota bacterium]
MKKRTAFIAALAIGLTTLVSPAAVLAQPATPEATAPAAETVQLNSDTAVTHGLAGKYVPDDFNVALGLCPAPGSEKAPTSTTFSSPVLTFANYRFNPTMGVHANVTADAELKPGTGAGSYQITMTCNGKPYAATFTVPGAVAKQVSKVPAGGAHAGDGSMAGQDTL